MPEPFYAPGGVAHWDVVETEALDADAIRGSYRDLGRAAGAFAIRACRYELPPGSWSPADLGGAGEEILFVLGGGARVVHAHGAHDVAAGGALLLRPYAGIDNLTVGADGLDVLGFRGGTDYRFADDGVAAVALEDLEPELAEHGSMRLTSREIGGALGSVTTGMSHVTISAGHASYPLHCHSAEEELFVVLEGRGEAEVGDERHPLRPGSVVARPAGTRVAHRFHAAADRDLVYLAWGTRDSRDITFFSKSMKVNLRGVGVIMRVEPVDYFDGED